MIVSIGTSGTVFVSSDVAPIDPSGTVAGFADTTGRFLPIVVTLNAARVLDAAGKLLGVDHAELSRLALSAPAGADGLVLIPYLEGERTPNRPDATGAIHGLTLKTSDPAHLARAAVEGMLCALADGLDALVANGARANRIVLVGGGARSEAVRRSRRRCSGCRCWSRRRVSTWPTAPPARPPGSTWAATSRRPGRPSPPRCTRTPPVPLIREQYAAAREAVIDRPR